MKHSTLMELLALHGMKGEIVNVFCRGPVTIHSNGLLFQVSLHRRHLTGCR